MFDFRKRLGGLLAGDVRSLQVWLRASDGRGSWMCAGVIFVGTGLYGATLGLWRDGLQAGFTALKFPLLVFLTCGANALLNGCLGQLLGSGLGFRQTTRAILMSFAVTAIILAAGAPLMLFLLWNVPPLGAANMLGGYSSMLLAHVAVIAFAGVAGARCLFRLLVQTSGSLAAAWRIFLGWLVGNLLLGAQLAWVLRPFIGSPGKPVQFFREEPLRGNFFAGLWDAAQHLF